MCDNEIPDATGIFELEKCTSVPLMKFLKISRLRKML